MIAKSNFNSFAPIFRFIVLFALFIINDIAFSQTYGLKFQSHDVVLDKRTELDLSPDQLLNFRDEFEISFDYRIDLLKPNDYSGLFGYIFRVISLDNNNIDLLITPTPAINLSLVIGKNNSIIQVGSPNKALDSWLTLIVGFVVMENGKIEGIKILKGLGPNINSMVFESFLTLLGEWKPVKLNNQNVRYFQVFPINFIYKAQQFEFAGLGKGGILHWGAY
ncbi:MAG: hypothetical protein Q8N05_08065 [Bacteroidota bacterium]|nr:hypothetical protein [Bacteroidota bacterium]